MAELALGARDAHLVGVVAEDALHGLRFGLVAQRRAGAVGVDVVDRSACRAARRSAHWPSPAPRRCLVRRAA